MHDHHHNARRPITTTSSSSFSRQNPCGARAYFYPEHKNMTHGKDSPAMGFLRGIHGPFLENMMRRAGLQTALKQAIFPLWLEREKEAWEEW